MDDEKVEMKVDISHKKEGKYIKQYHDRNLEQYSTPIMNPDKEYCYCILCKNIFNDRYRFIEHVKSTHQKNYTCHHCNYRSEIFYHHKSHIQTVHEGIRYACPQCDHKAMSKGNLNSHMRSIHEGVTYPCALCDFKAKQSTGLKRHMALSHNIGQELSCKQCDFKTRNNAHLKIH